MQPSSRWNGRACGAVRAEASNGNKSIATAILRNANCARTIGAARMNGEVINENKISEAYESDQCPAQSSAKHYSPNFRKIYLDRQRAAAPISKSSNRSGSDADVYSKGFRSLQICNRRSNHTKSKKRPYV